jgi:hypothetical protein
VVTHKKEAEIPRESGKTDSKIVGDLIFGYFWYTPLSAKTSKCRDRSEIAIRGHMGLLAVNVRKGC